MDETECPECGAWLTIDDVTQNDMCCPYCGFEFSTSCDDDDWNAEEDY